MRIAPMTIALALGLAPPPPLEVPFVAIGVWYAGPGVQPPLTATADIAALRRDLAAIRRAGFNAVTTWINWRDAEPKHGAYVVAGAERLIAAAVEVELKVSVAVFTDPTPDWAAAKPDGAARFMAYIAKRLSVQPGVLSVERGPPPGEAPAGRIRVAPAGGPAARLAMWRAIARGERHIAFLGSEDPLGPTVLSLGETAGVVTRNQALFAPLRPRTGGVISVTGAGGIALGKVDGQATPPIVIGLLESPDALMIIGLNSSPSPQKTTVTFSAEISEAIWQNLETGAAVHFVMGKSGPFLDHTFAPRDALVLMIRKTLR